MSLRDQKTTGTIKSLTYKAKAYFAHTSSIGIGSNQSYISDWSDAFDYDVVRGFVYISGSEIGETIGGTFEIQQSSNTGSAQLTSSTYNVVNNVGKLFDETLYGEYVRLSYTNNAASGSAFTTGSFVVNSYLIP